MNFLESILEDCDKGSGIKVWAQIESKLALENMESILEEADAILLSRVSLTQDLPPEKLFLAQKKVLASCNKVNLSAQSKSTRTIWLRYFKKVGQVHDSG